MKKNDKIIEYLAEIKNICEAHIPDNRDYPLCNDCPFFSFREGNCLIRSDNPYEWNLNEDDDIWRALL